MSEQGNIDAGASSLENFTGGVRRRNRRDTGNDLAREKFDEFKIIPEDEEADQEVLETSILCRMALHFRRMNIECTFCGASHFFSGKK